MSDLGAGLLYLQAACKLIIIFNISLAKTLTTPIAVGNIYLLIIEELTDLSLHLLSGFFVAQLILRDDGLEVEVSGNLVSRGHDVVVVHSLHESLHLGASLNLLLAHVAGNLQGVSLNAGNEGVRELLVL